MSVALLLLYSASTTLGSGSNKLPLVVVNGPTIIAFYEIGSAADPVKRADANESLADFQFYAKAIKPLLAAKKIKFHELYVSSFRVKVEGHISMFRADKGVGYYLIAPEKKPRIDIGVMTDSDLLQEANNYFANFVKSTP